MTVPAGGSVYVVLMLPEPDALPQAEPTPDAEHVQAHEAMPVGTGSTSEAPTAADGPSLVTTTEYVTVLPAVN